MNRTGFSLFLGLSIVLYIGMFPIQHIYGLGFLRNKESFPGSIETWYFGVPFPYRSQDRYTFPIGNQSLSFDTESFWPPMMFFDWLFFAAVFRFAICCIDWWRATAPSNRTRAISRINLGLGILLLFLAFSSKEVGNLIFDFSLGTFAILVAMISEYTANQQEAES